MCLSQVRSRRPGGAGADGQVRDEGVEQLVRGLHHAVRAARRDGRAGRHRRIGALHGALVTELLGARDRLGRIFK
ncbi:hypothetical protein ABZZ80_37560, partial [Streptomyces sp. NPDC006356]